VQTKGGSVGRSGPSIMAPCQSHVGGGPLYHPPVTVVWRSEGVKKQVAVVNVSGMSCPLASPPQTHARAIMRKKRLNGHVDIVAPFLSAKYALTGTARQASNVSVAESTHIVPNLLPPHCGL
jgi:hypothetical protein